MVVVDVKSERAGGGFDTYMIRAFLSDCHSVGRVPEREFPYIILEKRDAAT